VFDVAQACLQAVAGVAGIPPPAVRCRGIHTKPRLAAELPPTTVGRLVMACTAPGDTWAVK